MKRKAMLKCLSAAAAAAILLSGFAPMSYAEEISLDETAAPEESAAETDENGEAVTEAEGEDTSEETAETETEEVTASDPLNLEAGTIVSNLFLQGESLSGLSEEEALEKVTKPIENLQNTEFVIDDKDEGHTYSADCDELGFTWDSSEAEAAVSDAVQKGTLLDRYKKAKDYQNEPKNLDLNIECDADAIISSLTESLADWNQEAKDAQVAVDCGNISVTPSQDGLTYDFSEGIREMVSDVKDLKLDDSGKYEISFENNHVEPDFTTERANSLTVIGTFSTQYSAPTTDVLANRQQNLIQSTSNMNGTVIAPGDEGSALTMYGSVTLEGGYRSAGTIQAGVHIDQIGGGICQTTTTLYNALLMAELEITYRHNHSMMVNYVDPSRDAMVYAAGGSDFKFRNNTDEYIIINSYVDTSNCTVNVNIIGKEIHGEDHQVWYESVIDSIQLPAINVVHDSSMAAGWTTSTKLRVADSSNPPVPALTSHLLKHTVDNGVETVELFTGTDYYKAYNGYTVYCAPDVNVQLVQTSDRSNYYVSLVTTFLDGTSVSSDPFTWSDEQLSAFNARMKAACPSWPDTGTQISIDGQVHKANAVPAETTAEEETKKADSDKKESETTKATETSGDAAAQDDNSDAE